jgi:hypothetical protein
MLPAVDAGADSTRQLNAVVVQEGLCDRRPIGAISRRTIGHRHILSGRQVPVKPGVFGPTAGVFRRLLPRLFHVERARCLCISSTRGAITWICNLASRSARSAPDHGWNPRLLATRAGARSTWNTYGARVSPAARGIRAEQETLGLWVFHVEQRSRTSTQDGASCSWNRRGVPRGTAEPERSEEGSFRRDPWIARVPRRTGLDLIERLVPIPIGPRSTQRQTESGQAPGRPPVGHIGGSRAFAILRRFADRQRSAHT